MCVRVSFFSSALPFSVLFFRYKSLGEGRSYRPSVSILVIASHFLVGNREAQPKPTILFTSTFSCFSVFYLLPPSNIVPLIAAC